MTTAGPRRRSRRWIGFFVVLAVLAVVAVVVPLLYNQRIQLRPEQLAEARQRWRANAPADYNMEFLSQNRRGGQEERLHYRTIVRTGRVVAVADLDRGEVVYLAPSLALVAGTAASALSSDDPLRYDMPALFDEIEAALRQNATAERRTYIKADFDKDGYLSHYVHYDPHTKDRIEWFVKLSSVP
jgi:hypothetical protein